MNMIDLNVWLIANATLMGTEITAILVCKSTDEQGMDGIFTIPTVSVINVHTVMQIRFVAIIEVLNPLR